MKTYRKTLFCFIVMFLSILIYDASAVAPKVIKTIPANGEQNVSPALAQITIEFDQDMNIGGGFSICSGGDTSPEFIGKPKWLNKRTLIANVKLKPNYVYEISVNCPSYQNCKGVNGEPAENYPVTFKTGSGSAKQNAGSSLQASAVLLQQGIYAEETEGNLEKAMGIYTRIRSDYNDVERIAARATYQLGLCHLKKGDKDAAAKYFEEVVDYFPDQKSVAEKAQAQLDKLGIRKDAAKNIFEILQQTTSYIGSKYGELSAEAGVKKLYSNCHIYVVDKDFIVRSGGFGYIYNLTDKPITEKYRIGGTSYPNQKLYDITGNLINYEITSDNQIYWIPKEPLLPGSFFNYGWALDGSKPLTKTGQGYQLKMNNLFGDHCIETFFLAVPEGMRIASQSEEYTGKGNSNGWDIYWWKKEVPENTNHTVSAILTETGGTQEIHYDIEPNGLMNFYMPSHIKNNGAEPIVNNQFRNSDFVNLTKMIDDKNMPVEFTSTHQGSHFQYNVTFNPPIKPGEEFNYTMYGTMNGLIKPVPDMKDTYQYYMKHHPGSDKSTLRIETYLLPKGVEVISTIPPAMKQTEKDGRIELSVEEVIPPGGSIKTEFQYKLAGAATKVNSLQELINTAQAGGTVEVTNGVYTQPIQINKSITLKGQVKEDCIFEITADSPAIFISQTGKEKVTIENLTIKWQLATSNKTEQPFALGIRDGNVEIKNCVFAPLGNEKRSPIAVNANGFSSLDIVNCRFDGFDYVICYGEGTQGSVKDSIVTNCGHQGVMLYANAKVNVTGNIIAGSKYHAVRSTGGTLTMSNNLIINNKNRGVYLGNKSAKAEITNNAIIGNATGISGFASSNAKIENNVIANSSYSGIDFRKSCSFSIRNNILTGNEKGWIMFNEGENGGNTSYMNTFWQNKTDVENFDKTGDSISADPCFADAENGDFSVKQNAIAENKQGLTNPETLKKLWGIWKNLPNKNSDLSENTTDQSKLQAEDLVTQGWKLWEERKLRDAEETFKKAIEMNPQSSQAYNGLGWSQRMLGKKLNAKDSFEKCIALEPKNGAALNGLGWLAHDSNEIDNAIEWWQKAVEASNGTATASLSGLTQVYMEKGDYQNAVKYYEMWLKVEPNNADAKAGLENAKLAIKSGK